MKFLKCSGFTSHESILDAGKVLPAKDIELLLLELIVGTLLA